MNPVPLVPVWLPKKWGGELVVCNNEEFCGKVLRFKAGARFSMHFHAKKREVFYVLKGEVLLSTIDPATAETKSVRLCAGDCVEIPRLLPHRIEAWKESEVVEFSTHHEDSDSYRVAPGDSQLQE